MNDFSWEGTLDDGREVMVHACDYESADWSVGLGEDCNVFATNGEEITDESGLVINEVELSDKEIERFMEIGLNMYHDSWRPEYPD